MRARTERADSNRTPARFPAQQIQRSAQHRAFERRVQVEHGPAAEIRFARVLLDERHPPQVERFCRPSRTFDVGRLQLNSDAPGPGPDCGQDRNMTQAGADIDQHIVLRKTASFQKVEDVSCRCGLVRNHFRDRLDHGGFRFFELQNTCDYCIQKIVAFAVQPRRDSRLAQLRQPMKQAVSTLAPPNIAPNGRVGRIVSRLEPDLNRPRPVMESGFGNADCRGLRRQENQASLKLIEGFDPLS